ncbi:hypothetical protein [Bradyrhizobium tropiciagri]|uniref:hypothetical protein n=1 Tax=Bradyrhizobium tropiciagri TaxID=312253 RepID=UPI00067DEC2E|nr:hypothetical protein [Bradyrhizobium tropiciagri]
MRIAKSTASMAPASVTFDIARTSALPGPTEPVVRAKRSNSGQRFSTLAMLETRFVPATACTAAISALSGGSDSLNRTVGSPKPAARKPACTRSTMSTSGSLRLAAKIENTATNMAEPAGRVAK